MGSTLNSHLDSLFLTILYPIVIIIFAFNPLTVSSFSLAQLTGSLPPQLP